MTTGKDGRTAMNARTTNLTIGWIVLLGYAGLCAVLIWAR
jgi:hypothetical protein